LEDGDKEEHVPTPAERRRMLETTPLGKLEQRAEGLQAKLDDLQLALSSAIVAVEERQQSSSQRLSFVAKSAVGVRSIIHEKLETREQKQKSSNELARELGEVAGWRAPCPLVVRTMFSLVVEESRRRELPTTTIRTTRRTTVVEWDPSFVCHTWRRR
jgi:hypothetical protein